MSESSEKDATICANCGRNPATVHVRRVAGGEETDLHVCASCAKELGAEPPTESAGGLLSDPLTVMFKSMEETAGSGAVCGSCGFTYSQFKDTGRLGCSECYETFREELDGLLRKIHGSIRHLGKTPQREGKVYEEASRIKRLTDELERAVVSEDYERAAELRDVLRGLEPAGGIGESGGNGGEDG
jgi:protein arginine kinase activator